MTVRTNEGRTRRPAARCAQTLLLAGALLGLAPTLCRAEESTLSQDATKAGHAVGHTAHEVGVGTKEAAKKVGHGVADVAVKIGHGVRDGAIKVGHAFRDGGRAFGHAIRGDDSK